MSEQTDQIQQHYKRFSGAARVEHFVLIISFTMLAVTGLPQRYATDSQFARDFIDAMGGIESVRLLHRFFAIVLMGGSIYHGGIVSYNLFVRRVRWSMLPTITDVRNVYETLMFNVGLRREHPKMPRFNFGEKAEYLALVWGTLIMIITGFMLWNPIATTCLLPGVAIPMAQAAHSAEALLAVLSILVWHFYNVHIKQFNRSMFTGTLSRKEMEAEHGLELERLDAGDSLPPVPDDVLAKRLNIFYPYASAMTVLLVAGLVWFVTFEDSAITTVDRQDVVTSIGTINLTEADPVIGEVLWFQLPCQSCHGLNGEGVTPIPAINIETIELDVFAAAIRRGPADMPAFDSVDISDEEIAHLYAYITDID